MENNIHILPTDKPSRLQKNKHNKLFLSEENKSYSDCISQNIYITNDEEIKEGDWFIANNGVHKCIRVDNNTSCPFITLNSKGEEIGHFKTWRTKIILTTDQDLIKDGVQSIDDEFLEWFVKNPSCETVEVEKWFDTSHIDLGIGKVYHNNPTIPLYKIIIPKEEPKQTVEEYEQQGLEKYSYELKQETLEEAIERLYGDGTDCKGDIIKSAIRVGRIDAFYDATKWQQERSEEEIIWALLLCSNKKFKNSLEVKEWWNNFNSK